MRELEHMVRDQRHVHIKGLKLIRRSCVFRFRKDARGKEGGWYSETSDFQGGYTTSGTDETVDTVGTLNSEDATANHVI